MAQRRLTDKQRSWLLIELDDWSNAGILTPEQRDRILNCYETTSETSRRKHSLYTFAILGIAALFMGLAVMLLIAHNWNAVPGWLKLVNILVLLAGTHAAAFYLRCNKQVGRWSEVVHLLACLLYGAGIWVVGQVFHLDAHWPDAVWWWAIGVLPFALCLDTILLHCLFVALMALWAGVEVIGFTHLGPRLFWGWWMLPNGAYSLPLLAVPGLLWAYRNGSLATVSLYVPLLSWWAILQAIAWGFQYQSVFFVGSIGALLLIVAENHRRGSPYAVPHRAYGTMLIAGALVPLSFVDFCEELNRELMAGWGPPIFHGLAEFVAIVLLLGATLVGCVIVRAKRGGEAATPSARLLQLVYEQWVPVTLAVSMAFLTFWNLTLGGQRHMWIVPVMLANAGMVVFAVWLMRVGLRDDRGRPFAFGVLYFLLWAAIRYVDLFGEKLGMLGGSLMFFLCGAALFGLAIFWRRRKEVRNV